MSTKKTSKKKAAPRKAGSPAAGRADGGKPVLTEAQIRARAKRRAAKRRKKRRKLFFKRLTVALLVLAALALGGYLIYHHYFGMIEHGEESVAIRESVPEESGEEGESVPADSRGESESRGETESRGEESVPEESGPDETESEYSRIEVGGDVSAALRNWHNHSGEVYRDPDCLNVLLIGIDSRGGNNTYMNTDVMMVATVNERTGVISLTSLLRDCYVFIPRVGGSGDCGRLNAAAAWGGIPLLIETIEMNFGIHIDHYAKVDFNSFIDVIDLLGGVDVTLSPEEAHAVNRDLDRRFTGNRQKTYPESEPISEEGGLTHLNGQQALTFCRLRKIDDDFNRTERQRKTLTAVIAKAKKMSLGDVNRLAKAVLPYVETDRGLTETKVLGLAAKALTDYLGYDLQSLRIPVWGCYDNVTLSSGTRVTAKGAQVLYLDFAAVTDYFFEKVYGK